MQLQVPDMLGKTLVPERVGTHFGARGNADAASFSKLSCGETKSFFDFEVVGESTWHCGIMSMPGCLAAFITGSWLSKLVQLITF